MPNQIKLANWKKTLKQDKRWIKLVRRKLKFVVMLALRHKIGQNPFNDGIPRNVRWENERVLFPI